MALTSSSRAPHPSTDAGAVLAWVMINVFFVRYMSGRMDESMTPCPHRLAMFFVRVFAASKIVPVCPDVVPERLASSLPGRHDAPEYLRAQRALSMKDARSQVRRATAKIVLLSMHAAVSDMVAMMSPRRCSPSVARCSAEGMCARIETSVMIISE